MKTNKDIKASIELAEKVHAVGGRAYFVGGCVRDELLGIETKDIDIEVHGIEAKALIEILDSISMHIEKGKSFGVYGLKGYNIDIALPRSEVKTGAGHKSFEIEVNPYIGTKSAGARRDFTINALMKDILTGEIVDNYNGLSDLKNKLLRHISDKAFGEDSLRVFRAAQFSARFGFKIDKKTVELCKKIDVSDLSSERVETEMKKALLKAEKPSVFFEALYDMNALNFWFPEVFKLKGILQNPTFHPEGDVFRHTMEVLDRGVKLREKASNPYYFMLSCLVHDFGKPVATENINGVIHTYNHETLGLPIIEEFIKRISNENDLIKYVKNMALLHMKPNITFNDKSSKKATNKMFDEALYPKDLILLAMSDKPSADAEAFLVDRYEVFKNTMSKRYVQGKDLIEAGFSPNESFSKVLSFAHKLRISDVPFETALKECISYYKKLEKCDKN